MFATFPTFFAETYHFSPGIGGLAYLGLGFGFLLATIFGAKFADGLYKWVCYSFDSAQQDTNENFTHQLANKNDGNVKPEMRIPALFIGSLFVPVGMFWYGWSAAAKTHWILPIIGSGFFGFGMMTTLYVSHQVALIAWNWWKLFLAYQSRYTSLTLSHSPQVH